MQRGSRRAASLAATAASLAALLASCARAPAELPQSNTRRAIERAADEENVPRPLLLAMAFTESRFSMHGGQPGNDGGYGLFHLVDRPDAPEAIALAHAARLTGLSPEALRSNAFANALGGAALLREQATLVFSQYRDLNEANLGDWFEPVMLASGIRDARLATDFAAQVFSALRDGVRGTGDHGVAIGLAPQIFKSSPLDSKEYLQSFSATGEYCPGGHCVNYVQAANYTAGRGGNAVQYVVIHDMEGYYQSSIDLFTNPSEKASIHYDVRSSDGEITQQVHDGDTAWHDGNWDSNQRSIGIEHEGFAAEGNKWYTEAMYQSSAALTRWLTDMYHIPKDRTHIIGHYEVPDPGNPGWFGGASNHHDPCDTWAGAPTWHNVTRCFWDWDHYMALVTGGAGPPPPPPAKGTLEGFVGDSCCGTGAGKKPLAGSVVTLLGTQASTTTNSDGVYQFSLDAGSYTPRASHGGYADGEHTSVGGTATVAVAAGKTTWGSILLRPDIGKPSILIASPANGATVSTTPVTVSGTASGSGVGSVEIAGKSVSLSNGAFSALVGLALGANTITATASNGAGTATATIEVTYALAQTGVEGTLRSGALAVSGATVELSGHASARTQSTPDGSYRLAAPAGAYTLTVHAAGYDAASQAVTVSSGFVTVDLELTAAAVVLPPGLSIDSPVEGDVLVTSPVMVSGSVDDPGVASVQVNGVSAPVNAGTFQLPVALATGANTIAVTASNQGGTGSAVVHVQYVPVRTGIQGTITDSDTGAAVANAKIALTTAAAGTSTDAQGHYQLDAPAGTATLTVTAAGYTTLTQVVELSADEPTDLDYSISVATSDTGGGGAITLFSPDPGAVLRAASVDVTGAVDDVSVTSVLIDGVPTAVNNGQFIGSAQLKEGPNTITVVAQTAAGQASATVQVTYTTASTGVAGLVSKEDGTPIANAVVALQGAAGPGFTQTGTDGRYFLAAVGGDGSLSVHAAGFVPARISLSLTDGQIDQDDVTLAAAAAGGAPTIWIAAPLDGAVLTETPAKVRGVIDDPQVAAVQIDGQVFPAEGGIFTGTAALTTGANTITISATGASGSATASVSVSYAPARTGLSGQITSATDGDAVHGAVVLVDGGGHGQSDDSGDFVVIALAGERLLTVKAFGFADFTRSVQVQDGALSQVAVVLVPAQKADGPRVSISAPSSGDTIHGDSVQVSGTAQVPHLASLAIDGQPATLDASGAFHASVHLDPGDNQIYVRATDSSGAVYADAVYVVSAQSGAIPSARGCQSAGGELAFLALPLLLFFRRRRRRGAA